MSESLKLELEAAEKHIENLRYELKTERLVSQALRTAIAKEADESSKNADECESLRKQLRLLCEDSTVGDFECVPACDKWGHSDECPSTNPGAAWRKLKEERSKSSSRADKLYQLLRKTAEALGGTTLEGVSDKFFDDLPLEAELVRKELFATGSKSSHFTEKDRDMVRRAWVELNAIRARDGAPMYVCENYFNDLVEELKEFLGDDAVPWKVDNMQPAENTTDWDPFAPIETLPKHIQDNIKSERGHVSKVPATHPVDQKDKRIHQLEDTLIRLGSQIHIANTCPTWYDGCHCLVPLKES